MIYLLYRVRRVNDYPVVPLMVLQEVVVFLSARVTYPSSVSRYFGVPFS